MLFDAQNPALRKYFCLFWRPEGFAALQIIVAETAHQEIITTTAYEYVVSLIAFQFIVSLVADRIHPAIRVHVGKRRRRRGCRGGLPALRLV